MNTPRGVRHWAPDPTSRRTTPRPLGWKAIREQVLRRCGGRCEWIHPTGRCPDPATEVDHIDDPEDHSLDNLRGLCQTDHARRTSRQANAARKARRVVTAKPHPGLLG